MVSLATVSADEGYIPFFPDFLEPDGIGYRGPSEISKNDCWSNGNCDFEKHDQTGTTYSWGQWSSVMRRTKINDFCFYICMQVRADSN